MNRSLLALTLTVLVAAAGRADLGPRPGMKRVQVHTSIKLAKAAPEFTFYVADYSDSPYEKLNLEPGKAVPLGENGRFDGWVLAIPTKYATSFKDVKALSAAVRKEWQNSGNFPAGIVKASGTSRGEVSEKDKREALRRVLVATPQDAKPGLTFVTEEEAGPKKQDDPTAAVPPARLLVVGIAAALALVASGVWVIRRK